LYLKQKYYTQGIDKLTKPELEHTTKVLVAEQPEDIF